MNTDATMSTWVQGLMVLIKDKEANNLLSFLITIYAHLESMSAREKYSKKDILNLKSYLTSKTIYTHEYC